MNFKKRVNGSWTDISHYIHNTSTDTITTLPAVVYANGATATVGLKGQTVQSSIPSPTSPVITEGVGERTGNLFDFEQLKNAPSGTIGSITFSHVLTLQLKANTYYTMASNGTGSASSTPADLYRSVYFNATTGESSVNKNNPVAVLTDSTGVVRIGFFSERTNAQQYLSGEAQLWINEGSIPLPYENFGYKIPISSAGQTTPVYLGEVETTRKIRELVLTGEENFNTDTYLRFQIYINDIKTSTSRTGRSYCSHYECLYHAEPYDNDWNNVYYQSGGTLYFHDKRFSAVADFKSYLAAQYAAGTPVTVWYVLATETTGIVNEPLMKIGEYADSISGISIPTIAGANTLDVQTTLKPSEVTANFNGWHPVSSAHERENGQWD